MEQKVIELDGYTLNRHQIEKVAYGEYQAEVPEQALERVRKSRKRIETQLDEGKIIYGVNTGFGKLSDVVIEKEDISKLQLNLLRADAVGIGDPLPTPVVRTMMVLRANALAKGFSGIREETLNLLIEMINKRVHPVVPSKGSVGASGDLAPLAHIAIVLVGEGKAEYEGEILTGKEALWKAGLQPVELAAKEGLALINGTQAMSGIGVVTLNEAERVGLAADMAASLTMEALHGVITAFNKDLLAVRPHPEFELVASRIRNWLEGSKRITKQGEVRVQDAYSIRGIPQVHGASWQTINYVDERLKTEINAATDNPIILENGEIYSSGHFHGQPIALAMDFLKVATAEWANISERRIERLVNPALSGLSPFLATNPGLECGLMVAQYAAAALVSENKVLAHPASVDSIPTSANQEDHVSMGTIGSRQARDIVHNTAKVIAIELISASQAIYLDEAEDMLAPATKKYLDMVREICPPLKGDQDISEEIEKLAAFILREDVLK
ncbi:histidine ammonia-lyase [Virgibacillus halodenitrificans]|uniref:Histidine ammonia-lyase n=1 Tax=Virgibacillus halodenitrificans TaxID=1482 RepID=A0AAC9J2Q5_VIRHA|nr:histidine ammonia-lyase [Virgibacillus halodenitrificans]APC49503.1 histidine ammonia-lyase [Virgibacillus halodenitrificans]MCJ0929843.1 histidine ammonia-lyase [Virgibacillus halodenitrificans]WHX26335.1 histidine ammonia-lyase [Virgibacillus halodenitrificans]